MQRPLSLSTLLAAVVLASACKCGDPGTIVGAEADTSFVTEPEEIVFEHQGLTRILLDGSGRRPLFEAGLRAKDLHAGTRRFLLEDSATNLFVADVEPETRVRGVTDFALFKRVSAARFSPDASQIAVSRHADFDKPQEQWVDDDGLYIVDYASLSVRHIPARSDRWIVRLGWNAAGTEVWTETQDGVHEWVNLATGERRPRDPNDRPDSRADPYYASSSRTSCPNVGDLSSDDTGITLTTPAGEAQKLVTIEGRERGFHDYLPTVESLFFSQRCEHVVFTFTNQIWVAQVATGRVGPLTRGSAPFPWPTPRS